MSRVGSAACGVLSRTTRVESSVAVIPEVSTKELRTPACGDLVAGSRMWEMVYFASAAVKVFPLWKVTPLRRWNVQVEAASDISHEVARSAAGLPSPPRRTSRLYSAPRYS